MYISKYKNKIKEAEKNKTAKTKKKKGKQKLRTARQVVDKLATSYIAAEIVEWCSCFREFVFPPNAWIENLMTKVMVLRGETFGKQLSHGGRALINGSIPFIK